MKKIITNWWGALLLIVFAAGCGGGGGGGPTGIVAATVSSTTPANNVSGVAMNSVITATFSKAMDPQTIDAASFTVAGVTGTVSYDATSRTAIFMPSGLAADTQYTATVTTRAKDLAGGAMAANYTWSFTTGPDTTAPTVIATTPIHNAAEVAVNSAIAATFSEAMDPATIDAATFTVAGVEGTISYDVPSKTAILRPSGSLAAGAAYTATITTGAKDLAGNVIAVNYTWNFTTSTGPAPDITPPTVSSTIPATDATGVAINSGVLVNFSKAMDPTTINDTTFTLTSSAGNVTGTVSIDAMNRIAIFRPSGNLATGTTYAATIKAGVKDLQGNAMTADYTWSFTTGSTADTTPPTVIIGSVNPQPGASNIPVNTKISLTFSEPVISFAAGTIDGRPAPVVFADGNTTATMTPTTNLKSGYKYTFTFADLDLTGNRVLFTWSFTTQ
ncbi:MAG: hypothetical protein FD174_4059 [Geobacteraceae bacterium]|nr:MAG: hypothetical protein FD174_4059 [Geobacteraceae bacterium]